MQYVDCAASWQNCCLLVWQVLARCKIAAACILTELSSLIFPLAQDWAWELAVPLFYRSPKYQSGVISFQVFTHHSPTWIPAMCYLLLPPTLDHLLQDPQPHQLPHPGWTQVCQVSRFDTKGCSGVGAVGDTGGTQLLLLQELLSWCVIWDNGSCKALSSVLYSLWSSLAGFQTSWSAVNSRQTCCDSFCLLGHFLTPQKSCGWAGGWGGCVRNRPALCLLLLFPF